MALVPIGGGIELYCEEKGEGLPTVFVNGVAGTCRMWAENVQSLAKAARAISYDLRGQGGSSRDADPEHYSIEGLADDLARLLDGIGVGRAALVGTSLGGIVAQAFALRYPERTAALVLTGTAHAVLPDYRMKLEAWHRARTRVGLDLAFDVAVPLVFGSRYLNENARFFAAFKEQSIEQNKTANVDRLLEANMRWDAGEGIRDVRAPTLLVFGEHDAFTPVPVYARALERLIPGARLALLDSGHLCPVEQPREFNRLVRDFLAATPR